MVPELIIQAQSSLSKKLRIIKLHLKEIWHTMKISALENFRLYGILFGYLLSRDLWIRGHLLPTKKYNYFCHCARYKIIQIALAIDKILNPQN